MTAGAESDGVGEARGGIAEEGEGGEEAVIGEEWVVSRPGAESAPASGLEPGEVGAEIAVGDGGLEPGELQLGGREARSEDIEGVAAEGFF